MLFLFSILLLSNIFLHFPLSGPALTYISLRIIPCMIVYVTNNKEPWTLKKPNTFKVLMAHHETFRLCKKGTSISPTTHENKLCLSRGRTLNSRLSSQILSLVLVVFVLHHLVRIRCSRHIPWEAGTTEEQTSHTDGDSQCFPNPWGKTDTVLLRYHASRKNYSTVKEEHLPFSCLQRVSFEESLIKATQIKLQDLSCYFNTLIMYNSSSWGTNKNRFCVLKPITHEG